MKARYIMLGGFLGAGKTTAVARLAQHLIASLDPGEDVDAEAAWLAEAENRYQAYRQGKLTGKSADQVFREAKSHLL